MEDDEDYGFEYETDDDEEQDIDVENQVRLELCNARSKAYEIWISPFALQLYPEKNYFRVKANFW